MGFEREIAGWGGRLNRAAAAVSAGRVNGACARAGIGMTTGLIAGLCFTSATLARDGGAEHEIAAYSRHQPAVHRAYPGGPGASPDQRAAFVAWVCGHIERQARGWKLPRAYFARLIWKESRFDPNAISHKGAEGIAQFMPATARLRGLEDPFDPESAITASARYLAELRDQFGNLGLAAASYNAGAGRVSNWRAGRSGLPAETKDYVLFITGHSALAWNKPELPKTAFVLEKGLSFQTACRKLQIRRAPRARYAYAYNNRGIGYGRNGDHARAIGLYDTAIEVRPKFAKAYYNRGGAYRALGKYDLAIADYTAAIGLKPRYAVAYNNRGVAYQKKRDFDRAIADYDRAIKLDPKYANAYYNRAIAKLRKSLHRAAVADLSTAIKLRPKHAAAYNNRGAAHQKAGNLDGAIADYGRAIRLNPKYAAAHYNRGVAFHKMGAYARAIADLDRAIKLNPKHASAFVHRGLAQARLGQVAKAVDDFRRAMKLRPGHRISVAGLRLFGMTP